MPDKSGHYTLSLPDIQRRLYISLFLVKDAALAWLESLGWSIARGSDIAWYTRSA